MKISDLKYLKYPAVLVVALLTACLGGGGGDNSSNTVTTPAPNPDPVLNTIGYKIKQLILTWSSVIGADYYKITENPDGISGFTQIGANIPAGTTTFTHNIAVHLQDWANASYILESCDIAMCTDSAAKQATDSAQAIGYFKASNTELNDNFGRAVALSNDGSTLAVGAYLEDSSATGINGNDTDNSATNSGAVYVFRHDGTNWAQHAYIKASNVEVTGGDEFGFSVALSSDGNTLAVGAWKEDSIATGINGNEADDTATDSGAAYVFRYDGANWAQQAYVKASNVEVTGGDRFGNTVALSNDGNTLAVGASLEDSIATGINGNEADDTATDSGAAYIFRYDGANWTQQAYVKASNVEVTGGDLFGVSLALGADGNTLAVGAWKEDSIATGINGNEADDTATDSGAAYVFRYDGANWAQQAYVKASNVEVTGGDQFGISLALSNDGNTLAVGASLEDSIATGINGNEADDTATDSGAAYVFRYDGANWTQQAYVKASNVEITGGDRFGDTVALSNDGNTLAVGASREDSNSTGVGGDQTDNSANGSGAAYVFRYIAANWAQQSYVKASNTEAGDLFGFSMALSSDANTLAVAADNESSNATGVGGDQTNNLAGNSGAVYFY